MFLRCGMWAWAEACLERSQASGGCPPTLVEGSLPITALDHGDVRTLLAEMILGGRFEERN